MAAWPMLRRRRAGGLLLALCLPGCWRKTPVRIGFLGALVGGNAVEGMLVAQAYNRATASQRYLDFHAAYLARFGREPGYSAIASYDAVGVLAQALVQSAPGESLRDAVLHYQPYVGVQEPIRFDGFGDALRPAHFSVVRNGRFEPL